LLPLEEAELMTGEAAEFQIEPVAKAGADEVPRLSAACDIEIEFGGKLPVIECVTIAKERVDLADRPSAVSHRKIPGDHLDTIKFIEPEEEECLEIAPERTRPGLSEGIGKRRGIGFKTLEQRRCLR